MSATVPAVSTQPQTDDEWVAELKRFAGLRLPAHLVPDLVVLMDSLPRTPNGKADRLALPEPDLVAARRERPAETADETALRRLVADVLGLADVPVDADFFTLGGDSLLAMRLVARVRSTLDREISVRDVFDDPTVAGLAFRLRTPTGVRSALAVREKPARVPLSHAQLRMWFLNQFEGRNAVYNIPLALNLTGRLDEPALWAAFEDVLQRHEILRTVYPERLGDPYQRVLRADDVVKQFSTVSCAVDEFTARQRDFENGTFDVSVDPPLRVRLLAADSGERLLLIVVHHIAADGWSMAPLVHDLGVAYTTRVNDLTSPLPSLPVQYADFALWQREELGRPDDPTSPFAEHLAFWSQALAGLPDQLELPVDRPRPAELSHRGEVVHFTIGPELHQRVADFAARSGVSVFMVVQAALAATLSRLGGGVDIPIGTPVAGRSDPALDDLVGFFVNTLVLRTDVAGDPSFAELVLRVKEFDLSAFAHDGIPFEALVEALNPPRSLARHPLFQVLLAFQNNATAQLHLPGLAAQERRSQLQAARFDLLVNVIEPAGPDAPWGMAASIEYATDMFDRSTATRLAEYLVNLLAGAVADPEVPVSRLELRSVAEQELVRSWNATDQEVPELTLPALFAEQVRRTPELAAVTYGEDVLSYRQLDARANRLGRHLVRLGAGPETVVALAMERSAEMIVALWAVVKAGAAYLPIDPDYPADRIAVMLDDAAPVAVLTTGPMSARVPAGHPVVLLDDAALALELAELSPADLSDDERRRPLRPGHPLYVIYTSGSTGRPKGVVMPGAPIVHLLAWHRQRMGGGPGTVTAQFASLSFDAAAQEIFSATTSGKTLAVPEDHLRREPAQLARWLADCGANELFAPTPVVEAIVVAARQQGLGLEQLRSIAQAGEALVLSPAIREFCAAGPVRTLHNYYGPTETHVATGFTIADVADQSSDPPIGGPIWNSQAHVLDAHLHPAPIGVIGELYLAGACVARGYLNRPGATAERFLPNPFGAPGSRMYRTGDLARWRPDGNLEFLGRNDFQVKVRGFRVELGEIEAVLRAVPGVAQVVVTAHDAGAAGKQLVGYVVAAPGFELDPAELRAAVASVLPDYMVPAFVTVLASLPVTHTGKVDRQALPAPVAATDVVGGSPQTAEETALCAIFAEVLSLPEVGTGDNFFALGGHSLLAARLVAEIRTALGYELAVRDLFNHPSVRELADQLGPRPATLPTEQGE